ncbi:hypothetical protein VNO77_05883 [Canavalia gladiata]|uniref:Uncharacterized protein n=1 Tax=Canavalia gladiata TaxID=3824 RepID=A0AAN9MZ53_CANGL
MLFFNKEYLPIPVILKFFPRIHLRLQGNQDSNDQLQQRLLMLEYFYSTLCTLICGHYKIKGERLCVLVSPLRSLSSNN